MHRHGFSGSVNWTGRCQQGSVGLRLEVAVCALNVAFGQRVSGGAIQTHGTRGCGHSSVVDARRASEQQNLVGWRVTGAVSPSLALPIGIGDASLLNNG